MPKHNFVIFGSSWDLYKLAYADVNNYENIKYITYPTNLIGKGFYFYQKIENHLRLPLHNVFFHSFFKNDFKKQLPIVFLYFRGWVEHKIQTRMVNYYRKKYPDSKHILFLQDLVTTDKWNYPIYDAKDNYDIVLSFDPGDCQKYQLIYHPLVFSKYSSHNLSIKYDITFIGQGKNRLEELYSAFNKLICLNLNTKFILININNKDKRNLKGIEYVENIPYIENLKYIEQSKCILEIMQKGGTGYTQRGCEIVGLNKKLLTNNPYIKNAPFYNSKYISVFNSVDNMDIDFLKRLHNDEKVEFGEECRKNMSPIELLEFVEQQL